MAHVGKIACHFPDRGNPNLDVLDIRFLPEGTNPSTITDVSDMAHVTAVYMIPDGVSSLTLADLPNYLVWKYVDNLTAGDMNVGIEYTPTSDITITGIEIFTSQNSNYTNGKIRVVHESGLFVGAINGDSVDAQSELYELNGYKRYVNNAGIHLKAGNTYYFSYNDGSHDAYYPAYFEHTTGNYKVYYNDTDNITVTDMSTLGTNLGQLNDVEDFVEANEHDYMTWNGSTSAYGGSFPLNTVFVRNAVLPSSTYSYKGEIGSGNLSVSDMDSILSLPANSIFEWAGNDATENNQTILARDRLHTRTSSIASNSYKGIKDTVNGITSLAVGEYFIWNGSSSIITSAKLYQKTSNLTIDDTMTFSGDSSSYNTDVVLLMHKSYNANGTNKYVLATGDLYYGDKSGVYQLTAGYTFDDNNGDGYTPSTWTSMSKTFANNCIYYLKENGTYGNTTIHYGAPSACLFSNGNLDPINYWSKIQQYFNITSISGAFTQENFGQAVNIEGMASILYTTSISGNAAFASSLVSASLQTGRKYYLKLTDSNGNSFEV